MGGTETEHPVTDLWSFLSGSWRIKRRLFDRASGSSGTFTGTATFVDEGGGGMIHDEEGTLTWSAQCAVPTTRRLIMKPTSTASAMDVLFADGRPFHQLNLSTGLDRPEHPCPPDLYRGSFHVSGPDSWTYQWAITGPEKDLLLTSELRRIPGTDHSPDAGHCRTTSPPAAPE